MMAKQTSCVVLMVEPKCFGFNPDTAADNHFQTLVEERSNDDVRQKAQDEFADYVKLLTVAGVEVHVEEDAIMISPDAVYPNNWITFHEGKTIVLYPMKAANRRHERQAHVVKRWSEKLNARVVHHTRIELLAPAFDHVGLSLLTTVLRFHRVKYDLPLLVKTNPVIRKDSIGRYLDGIFRFFNHHSFLSQGSHKAVELGPGFSRYLVRALSVDLVLKVVVERSGCVVLEVRRLHHQD